MTGNLGVCFSSHLKLLDFMNFWNYNVFMGFLDWTGPTYFDSQSAELILESSHHNYTVFSQMF